MCHFENGFSYRFEPQLVQNMSSGAISDPHFTQEDESVSFFFLGFLVFVVVFLAVFSGFLGCLSWLGSFLLCDFSNLAVFSNGKALDPIFYFRFASDIAFHILPVPAGAISCQFQFVPALVLVKVALVQMGLEVSLVLPFLPHS